MRALGEKVRLARLFFFSVLSLTTATDFSFSFLRVRTHYHSQKVTRKKTVDHKSRLGRREQIFLFLRFLQKQEQQQQKHQFHGILSEHNVHHFLFWRNGKKWKKEKKPMLLIVHLPQLPKKRSS